MNKRVNLGAGFFLEILVNYFSQRLYSLSQKKCDIWCHKGYTRNNM